MVAFGSGYGGMVACLPPVAGRPGLLQQQDTKTTDALPSIANAGSLLIDWIDAEGRVCRVNDHEARELRIDARALHLRNPISAYDGKLLTGRVRRTWLRGQSVYDASEGGAGEAPWLRRPPAGRLLSRGTA